MIPKIIHFCWYGKGEYNDTIKKCIESWKVNLPDYAIKRWDESNTPFDKLPFLKLLYKQKKWAFIADYMRLYALYKEGGVYLDTDVEVIKHFDYLLQETNFIGFQSNLTSKQPFNNAVLGAVPNSSFIYDCIMEAEKKQRLTFNAMAGPNIISKVVLGYGVSNEGMQVCNNVTIVPTTYFYPFSWNETFSEECIKKETLCIHWWEDSWKSKKKGLQYYIDSIKRKAQKLPLFLVDLIKYYMLGRGFYLINKL